MCNGVLETGRPRKLILTRWGDCALSQAEGCCQGGPDLLADLVCCSLFGVGCSSFVVCLFVRRSLFVRSPSLFVVRCWFLVRRSLFVLVRCCSSLVRLFVVRCSFVVHSLFVVCRSFVCRSVFVVRLLLAVRCSLLAVRLLVARLVVVRRSLLVRRVAVTAVCHP